MSNKTSSTRPSGFTLINFLRKTIKLNPRGFTLIELLVVISIIAILAVVGVVSYTSLQKNARDTKRRAEIDSISKALEIRYQLQSGGLCEGQSTSSNGGTYCPLQSAWFNNNSIPRDVNFSATPYCIWYNNTNSVITANPVAWSGGSCPAISGAPAGTVQAVVAVNVPPVNTATTWKLCAVMEKDNSIFCINSKQ